MSELFRVDFPSGSTLIRDNLPSANHGILGGCLREIRTVCILIFLNFLNGFLVRLNASRRQRANT